MHAGRPGVVPERRVAGGGMQAADASTGAASANSAPAKSVRRSMRHTFANVGRSARGVQLER